MEEDIDFSVDDLTSIVNIIDLCAERGAFKGNELAAVGHIRGKLVSLIKQNTTVPERVDT